MKKLFLLLTLCLACVSANAQIKAQDEEVKPSYCLEFTREIPTFIYNNILMYNVKVEIKSNCPDGIWTTEANVKLRFFDSEGKVFFKKKFKHTHLYLYSDGQIEVGQPRFTKLLIFKSSDTDKYIGHFDENGVGR